MSSLPDLRMPEHSLDIHERTAAGKKTIDFVQLALDHWKWLALGAFLGSMMGVAAYMVLGPTYDATTGILVRRKAANVATDKEREIVVFSERGEHIALMKSPLIVQSAIKIGKLDELPTLSGSDDLVEDVIDNLKVERTAGSETSSLNVLGITFTSKNKEDAKKIVTAVGKAYDHYLKEEHRESVNETLDVVYKAIETLEEKVNQKKETLIEYKKSSPLTMLGPPGADGNRMLTTQHHEAVSYYQQQFFATHLKIVDLEARKEQIQNARARGASQEELEQLINEFAKIPVGQQEQSEAASAATGGTTMSQLLPKMMEMQKLARQFGEGHPDVKDLKAQILQLRELAQATGEPLPINRDMSVKDMAKIDFVQYYLTTIDKTLTFLNRNKGSIQSVMDTETQKAKDLESIAIEGNLLEDDFKQMDELLTKVETRLEDINVNNQAGYDMKELSPAKTALNVKRPIKMVGASMVLIAGMFYCLLYLREMHDKTVRTADDLRLHLGLPVIGGVPIYQPANKAVLKSSSFPSLDPTLCYAHKPGSLEAESFRSVRTAVLVQAEAEKAKILQVTSAEPGDGKSSIVANMAIALAQSGKRILIVEADLRRPVQSKMFGLEPQAGVAEVLSGEVHFRNAIQETVFPGLSIVVAGGECAAPAEMLSSRQLKESLEDIRDEYDLILVDTPPLLAVSDPCVTGRYTDGVLMVVRLNKNDYAYISRATELLQTHGIRLIGVLANGIFDMASGKAYGYGYGYGESDSHSPNDQSKPGGKVARILEPYVSA